MELGSGLGSRIKFYLFAMNLNLQLNCPSTGQRNNLEPHQGNGWTKAISSLPHLVSQVHIHGDLHLRVPHKDPGQGLLRGEVHFPAGPVELAGFQCYPHGVSIVTSVVRISVTPCGVD